MSKFTSFFLFLGSQEQQPLLSKIRREGVFKSVDSMKPQQDDKKPKYNLICIGSTKDAKNRINCRKEFRMSIPGRPPL